MMNERSSLYDGFALYASGVTLVTVRDGAEDQFFIAGSVLTASVDPFAIAVSIGKDRIGLPAILRGTTWSLSVLTTQHRSLVQNLSAGISMRDRLQFLMAAGAERSPEEPLWLPDSLVTFWCTVRSVTLVDDQRLVVGNVRRARIQRIDDPLLRWNRDFKTVKDFS
ncbi:MAG: flavin reductase family protein [Tessaracoccus sp.]